MRLVAAPALILLLVLHNPVQTMDTLPLNENRSAPNNGIKMNKKTAKATINSIIPSPHRSPGFKILKKLATVGSQSSSMTPSSTSTTYTTSSSTMSSTSSSKFITRYSKPCGNNPDIPQGSSGECDPAGDNPCCHPIGQSGMCSKEKLDCICQSCIDYRTVQNLRASKTDCTIARVGDFLNYVCSDEKDKEKYYFKCMNSDVSYRYTGIKRRDGLTAFSQACDNDEFAYQSCVFGDQIDKNNKGGNALCGAYYCFQGYGAKRKKKLFNCYNQNCPVRNICPRDSTFQTCDHKCDSFFCSDESQCNGFQYGIVCTTKGRHRVASVGSICDGSKNCDNNEDERDCVVTNATLHTCLRFSTGQMVPILNYTRCAAFLNTRTKYHPQYCKNFNEQTNCSDVELIAGHCLINGYLSSVSIFVVCGGQFTGTRGLTNLCDNGLDDDCVKLSSESESGCIVHKHRMCDGVFDCPNGSDELDDICKLTVDNFYCNRTFNFDYGGKRIGFPKMWILDTVTDCENGEDEFDGRWK